MVSHDLNSIKRYADEVLLLDGGKIHAIGSSNAVIHEYIKLIDNTENEIPNVLGHRTKSSNLQTRSSETRYGNKKATIEKFAIFDSNSLACDVIQSGETYTFEWHIQFHEVVEKPCTGIYLKTLNGFDLFSTNTYYEGFHIDSQSKGSSITVRFTQLIPLGPGNFVIGFGLSDMSNDRVTPIDRRYDALCFRVVGRPTGTGVLALRPTIEVISLSHPEQFSANAIS